MRTSLHKLAAAMAIFAMLLPGAAIILTAPTVSADTTYGRVSVSGTNILVNGEVPSDKFVGVVETTALQFAILAYIEGESGVAGKTSHLNGPDTSSQGYIPYHSTPEEFWHQYFAISAYLDTNLVRLGAGDRWGSSIQYEAWLNHHDAYIAFLKSMCEQAEKNGVWICLVLAGSQEYPTYTYGGSGSVFDPSSSAYSRYIEYCRDVMTALEGEDAIAMYDLFNEPDHNIVANTYWQGDKVRFNAWERAVARDTSGASTHPRTMGVAGLGNLFGWGKADFDLATGNGGFEILHRHYYASATGASNAYLFTDPQSWADQCGKPLYWGELAYNGVYPLTRWDWAEQTIWAAGGQAIAPMVLTGTPGYPYSGGLLPSQGSYVPEPQPELVFTSEPATSATVGTAYSYQPATSIACTLTLSTDAAFLSTSGEAVVGTPDAAGSYRVSVAEQAPDGRTAYQNYTLVVSAAPIPDEPTNPQPDEPSKSFWSMLVDWLRSLFGLAPEPAPPSSGSSNYSSRGFITGGGNDALLLIGAMGACVVLGGAYLVMTSKRK